MRAALGWAREQNAAETALRLAGALWRFWYTRGYLSEGRRWLDQALAMVENGLPVLHAEAAASQPDDAQMQKTSMAVRAKALTGAGGLAYAQGDYAPAQTCYEASLALFRELGDRRGVASSTNVLGVLAEILEDSTRANSLYQEALALFRELGDRVNVARILNNLGQPRMIAAIARRRRRSMRKAWRCARRWATRWASPSRSSTWAKRPRARANRPKRSAGMSKAWRCARSWATKKGSHIASKAWPTWPARAGSRSGPRAYGARPPRCASRSARRCRRWSARSTSARSPPHARSIRPFDAAFLAGQSMTLEQVAAEAKALVTIRLPDTTNKERITAALPAEAAKETGPRLIVAASAGTRVIPLNRLPLTIGRESNTDIALDDPRVSRQHARLSYRQQQIWLTDLRSSNGTFVNGEPIQERALQPGDLLSFGGLEATFEDTRAPASLGRGVSK